MPTVVFARVNLLVFLVYTLWIIVQSDIEVQRLVNSERNYNIRQLAYLFLTTLNYRANFNICSETSTKFQCFAYHGRSNFKPCAVPEAL